MTYIPDHWDYVEGRGTHPYKIWRHYFMLDGLIGMISITKKAHLHNLEFNIRLASGNEREPEFMMGIDDLMPLTSLLGVQEQAVPHAKRMIPIWLRFVGDRLVQLDYRDKGKQAIWTAIQHCLYQPDITIVTYGRTDEERSISAMLASPDPKSVALAEEMMLSFKWDYDTVAALYPMQCNNYGGWSRVLTPRNIDWDVAPEHELDSWYLIT